MQGSNDNAQGIIQNTDDETGCALQHQAGVQYSTVD